LKILVSGATGFIGRHVVSRLVNDGHSVSVILRSSENKLNSALLKGLDQVYFDFQQYGSAPIDKNEPPDVVVHLAWSGLPNYSSFLHLSGCLPYSLSFLQSCVELGVTRIIVAGTCLECGMQEGPYKEDIETKPSTPYGLAKDTLRKCLELLQQQQPFTLQWMRLFYTYGSGQAEKSLLSQLDSAIDAGKTSFNMSSGTQLRDFLPVEDVAAFFSAAINAPECGGVINCGSGRPTSVREIVEQHCTKRGSDISLNLGYYDIPDYEPHAFWAGRSKLHPFIASRP
jgi:nucleoside-diphosphate-sugar epimerase